jgi:hypothetical protein
MNHTKTTTLGIAAAIGAVAAVLMVAAAATATPLVTGHAAFAKSKVKIGDTKAVAIQAADNSQHCAFGAGSGTGNGPHTCDNRPDNDQTQTQNAGGTGTG